MSSQRLVVGVVSYREAVKTSDYGEVQGEGGDTGERGD